MSNDSNGSYLLSGARYWSNTLGETRTGRVIQGAHTNGNLLIRRPLESSDNEGDLITNEKEFGAFVEADIDAGSEIAIVSSLGFQTEIIDATRFKVDKLSC